MNKTRINSALAGSVIGLSVIAIPVGGQVGAALLAMAGAVTAIYAYLNVK